MGRALVQMDLGGKQVLIPVSGTEPVDASVQELPRSLLVQGIVAGDDETHRADLVFPDLPLRLEFPHAPLDRPLKRHRALVLGAAAVADMATRPINVVGVGMGAPVQLLADSVKAFNLRPLHCD